MAEGVGVESGLPGGLRGFAAENGWWLLLAKVAGGAVRRMRDAMLEGKLGTTGFRLGRSPKLLGLAHMRVGANFSGGHDLWLEAVTAFGEQRLRPVLRIGADCNVSDQVHIGCAHEVTIGNGFLCGSRVLITDHAHGFYGAPGGVDAPSDPAVRPNLRRLSAGGRVVIGENVWVGDGCAILPGAVIGDGAVIGANSVVTGEVPARTVAAGAPVRLLRRWDEATRSWVKLPRAPARH